MKAQKNDYFWLITGIETALVGLALSLVFFIFDERLPSIFLQIQMPYISFVMIIAGIAIALSFRKERLWMSCVAVLIWSYLMISFILEMVDPDSPFIIMPILFAILSAGLVTRIIIKARFFDRDKNKEVTHEN